MAITRAELAEWHETQAQASLLKLQSISHASRMSKELVGQHKERITREIAFHVQAAKFLRAEPIMKPQYEVCSEQPGRYERCGEATHPSMRQMSYVIVDG